MPRTAARILNTPHADALPSTLDTSAPMRDLSCGAGFFADAASAGTVRDRLLRELGLAERQVHLLAPGDARSRRFLRLSAGWRPRRAARRGIAEDTRWMAAGLGAMLVGFVGTTWAVNQPEMPLALQLLTLALSAAAGALPGWWLGGRQPAPSSRRRSSGQRFDQSVQRALADGQWAIVVNGVSPARQADVMALLRTSSLRWCVETSVVERLG